MPHIHQTTKSKCYQCLTNQILDRENQGLTILQTTLYQHSK